MDLYGVWPNQLPGYHRRFTVDFADHIAQAYPAGGVTLAEVTWTLPGDFTRELPTGAAGPLDQLASSIASTCWRGGLPGRTYAITVLARFSNQDRTPFEFLLTIDTPSPVVTGP